MRIKKICFFLGICIFNTDNIYAANAPIPPLSQPLSPSSLYAGGLFGAKYSSYTQNYTGLASLSSPQYKKKNIVPCLGLCLGYKYSFFSTKTLFGLEGLLMKQYCQPKRRKMHTK
jgi:hypothetical protein